MGKKHRVKGPLALQKCLSGLPTELIQLILEELARQAPHLGAWMLRTNSTLKRWIEPILYYEISLGHQFDQGVADSKLFASYCSRPSFFTEHVKVLSIGPATLSSFVVPFLTACTSVKSLTLRCQFYLLLFGTLEDKRAFAEPYWQAISLPQLRPTRLDIDLYQHLILFPKFEATHSLFSNVTHLELDCDPECLFLNENLLSLVKVIRLKVNFPSPNPRFRLDPILSGINTAAKFCPPNANICLIWLAGIPLEEVISTASILRISRGSLGSQVVLGTRTLDKDRDVLDRPGYQCILANWCLKMDGLDDIWKQAERIVEKRLNSEARVAGLSFGS
ncbi:hypothetical protein BDN72DRAFT_845592 [Pluteus cervinus]|uniref:Uncharacterized protein n=1 Tax=Pluteus cervinus TaxID=181527 RepID=A0ACD3AJ84_9AGAR|nr:hypothetical protein BDN72DRAFT_845592 [Pluteus cervinus]